MAVNRAERRAHFRVARRGVARQLKAYRPTLQDVARHEAGHAIAVLALDMPLDRVWIAEYEDSALGWHGQCEGAGVVVPTRIAIARWAGPLAEGTLLGSGEDLFTIKALNPHWVLQRGLDSPHWFATKVLAANLPQLQQLAALLAEHRDVTGDQIRDSIAVNRFF